MKTNQIRWGALTLTTIAFLLLAGTAGATPAIAPQFYGGVTINGGPAADGTMIVAKMDGNDRGSIMTLNGWYGGAAAFDPKLLVNAEIEEIGQTITFFVREGGIDYQTGQTAVFIEEGSVERLDLSATVPVKPNQVPFVQVLDPSFKYTNEPGFTLKVVGANFTSSSSIQWNGANRTTFYASSTELYAQIASDDIVKSGTAQVAVINPPPGGGISNSKPFSIIQSINLVPVIVSISPNEIDAGSQGFTLEVNGYNFVSSTVVRWNGVDKQTTYISSNQVSAEISSIDIVKSGTATITAFNPAPGGGTSTGVTFIIHEVTNPIPILISISPNSTGYGASGLKISVSGWNFIPSSIVRWNGVARTTSYNSETELIVDIPSSDLANPKTSIITVFNPPLGGGISEGRPFTVSSTPVEKGGKEILQGSDVFLGEMGLDIRNAVGDYSQIAWFENGNIQSTPTKVITINDKSEFDIDPMNFNESVRIRDEAAWYPWSGSSAYPKSAFIMKKPFISVEVVDSTGSQPSTLYQGDKLNFRIRTNLYTIYQRPDKPIDGFSRISVQNPDNQIFSQLYVTPDTESSSLTGLKVDTSPYPWANQFLENDWWNTGARSTNGNLRYPPGDYNVWASAEINGMKVDSGIGQLSITIKADTIELLISKSTVTRSGSFTATVQGRGGVDYYIWIYECPIKTTGYPCDQPPLISEEPQENVYLDPINGPWTIGAQKVLCCKQDGTIRDTIPLYPFNGTRYYARVKPHIPESGNVSYVDVLFDTSANTAAPRTYTIRVESKPDTEGRIISDQKTVTVENGIVTILANDTFYLGESLKISGINTDSWTTYLFLKGPCQATCGSNLLNPKKPVVYNEPDTFTFVPVYDDPETPEKRDWQLPNGGLWDTRNLSIDVGNYTIYALSKPTDYCSLDPTKSCPECICTVYAVKNITILKPYVEAQINPTSITIPQCAPCYPNCVDRPECANPCAGKGLVLSGKVTGNPNKTMSIWIFGENGRVGDVHFIHDYFPVLCDDTFSVNVLELINRSTKLQYLEIGKYDVIVQHPMYNHVFDVIFENEIPPQDNITYPQDPFRRFVVSTSPVKWSKVFPVEGPGSIWDYRAVDALTGAMYPNTPSIDDTYVKLSFEVKPEGVAPTPDTITFYPGWNIVSSPKKLATGYKTAKEVFSSLNMDNHPVLLYDGESKSWISLKESDEIMQLNGYWVYSKERTNLKFVYDSVQPSTLPSKQLFQGWNTIGYSGTPSSATARTVLLSLDTTWQMVIGYLGEVPEDPIIRGNIDPKYSDTKREMFATHGYWIYMNEAGKLQGME
jgi:hypothetical protein